jgi:predicted RecA/RadA family phage recombinase
MTTIVININECKRKKRFKNLKWFPQSIIFNFKTKTKGVIMTQSAKVDQVFLVSWPLPKDKYGNAANIQSGSIAFSSDDSSIATIEAANDDNGELTNAGIDPSLWPYTAKVTTLSSVGATMVRISADANLNDDGDPTTTDDVKTIEGTLTVEVLSGDAVGFGDPTATTPTDNTATPE